MRRSAMFLVALLALSTVPLTAATANEDDVIERGGCSASSDWKLKLSPENGGTEVEFEVDQNRAGQEWRVTLRRNGEKFFSGTRVTNERSGSFEVRKVVPQDNGDFTARARNPKTDEVCRGSASI